MQLFIQNVNELDSIEELIKNLSLERKERFLRFRQEKDKLACIACDYLIKKYVSTETVLYNRYGKPYINNALQFNLSHSGDYVILVTSDVEIGCDIEEIKDVEVKSISERAFHKKEIEQLKNANYDLKLFYKIWTAKESYMKMLGCGFEIEPKTFCVDLENTKLYEKPEGYIIAVTTKNRALMSGDTNNAR